MPTEDRAAVGAERASRLGKTTITVRRAAAAFYFAKYKSDRGLAGLAPYGTAGGGPMSI